MLTSGVLDKECITSVKKDTYFISVECVPPAFVLPAGEGIGGGIPYSPDTLPPGYPTLYLKGTWDQSFPAPRKEHGTRDTEVENEVEILKQQNLPSSAL